MNKLELIDAMKQVNGITKSEAAAVVNQFFDEIADALVNGYRVEVRGLCSQELLFLSFFVGTILKDICSEQ